MPRIEPDELDRRIANVVTRCLTITDRGASMPIRDGEWNAKQLLGHLIDSALNNHQRLIRVQINGHLTDGVLRIDGYEQDNWVAANGWNDRSWTDLITLWEAVNRQLVWLVKRFPEHAWRVPVALSAAAPVPLEDLLDYIEHLDAHLEDLRRVTLSTMPDRIACAHGVTLRLPVVEDVDWLVESCQDPEIPRWTGIPEPYTADTAMEFITRAERWRAEQALPRNYIVLDSDGQTVGMCGLVRVDAEDLSGEVGYWLSNTARGKGYATIATEALTAAVLRAGYRRVTGEVIVGNPASQRVLERCGFTHEGVYRSVGLQGSPPNVRRIDAHSYALIAGDPIADLLLTEQPEAQPQ
jgi:RimJ/RimL family protein N-acetyltransferase